jgi:isocitrate/isopropylmalate dehydrogenase
LIGSSIENARQRVLFDFNKGVINKALNKVKDKLPEDVIGRDAINYASKQVSNQYDDVLSKMSFDLDFATTSNILSALSKKTNLSPNQRQEVSQTLNDIVFGKFSGQKLDGKTFKGIESDLRKKASNYINSAYCF